MQRTVQYWRLVRTDGGPLDRVFPASAVVQELCRAEHDGLDRHLECRDGMVLVAHGIEDESRHSMVVLDKVRRANLPSVGDSRGVRRPIGLGEGEGLLEPTYCFFAENNIVALLTSGNGPRAKRLCDYLKAKLDIEVGLDPVLTRDLDRILDEMRISSVNIAIPAARINRDLVGGDWAAALEANRVLAQDGMVRVGVAVGRRGSRDYKDSIRRHIRTLVDQLRGSGAVSELQSARVAGTIQGSQRSVDLHADRFVEKTDVDADRLADPEASAHYAMQLLRESLQGNADYLTSVVVEVSAGQSSITPRFLERPIDERRV